jgi:two-component system OmpR family response regulator
MEEQTCVVVIDDDPNIATIVNKALGYSAHFFPDVESFRKNKKELKPVACFVDIILGSSQNGLDMVQEIRQAWPHTVIIIISAEETDRVIADVFASGADDFIQKPLNPREISARLRYRVQKAKEIQTHAHFSFADINVDTVSGVIKGPKGTSSLSDREMKLLTYLIDFQHRPIPRDELKRLLWGNLKVTDNSLQRKIYETRTAIRSVSDHIEIKSKYGIGVTLELLEIARNEP